MPRIDVDAWEKQVRNVPAKVVEQLCGDWQYKLRRDIAAEWGFPLVGETIDLIAVLKWLREFLKAQGPLLRVLKEDGEEGPLGVQYLRAKIAKTEADAAGKITLNAKKEGLLCDRETVHSVFELVASRFARAADSAQKKWGTDGFEFFQELSAGLEYDFRGLIENEQRGEREAVAAESDDSGDDV